MKPISSRRARALAIPPGVKRLVTLRDGGRCVYCGRPGLPEAHFIPRSRGGLGIEQNVLTLCRSCHDRYDNGPRPLREGMREYFSEYLSSQYEGWDETNLIYRKE